MSWIVIQEIIIKSVYFTTAQRGSVRTLNLFQFEVKNINQIDKSMDILSYSVHYILLKSLYFLFVLSSWYLVFWLITGQRVIAFQIPLSNFIRFASRICVCLFCFVLKHQVQVFEDPETYHHYAFKIWVWITSSRLRSSSKVSSFICIKALHWTLSQN